MRFGLPRADTQGREDQKRSHNKDRLLRLVGGGKHEESVYLKSKKARLGDQDGVQYIGDGKLDQGKDQDVDQEERVAYCGRKFYHGYHMVEGKQLQDMEDYIVA